MREPYGFKEVKLGDLFKVTGTKSTNAGNLVFNEEGINFVGRTADNNGIQGKVEELNYEPNEGNTITISQVGTMVANYQEEPYYTSQNIAKVYTEKLSKNQNLYLTTIINKHLNKYGGYVTPKLVDIKGFDFELPITKEGTPDYDYMEDYISYIKGEYIEQLEESCREEYHQLEALGLDDGEIELEEPYGYEYVPLKEMFKVRAGGRVTKKAQIEGNIPYVTAVTTGNGIENYISNPKFTENNILTVNFFGNVYYHPYEVAYKDGTYGLTPKKYLTKNQYLYLAGSIEKQTLSMGSYNNAIRVNVLNDLDIYLPITEEGTPDYDYMENYIKHIAYKYRVNRREDQEEEIRLLREMV